MWHRLSEIDEKSQTAWCSACESEVRIRYRSKTREGKTQWRCVVKDNARNRKNSKPYLLFKGDTCSRCGFEAEDSCQLDVDHIDGNHANNNPDNLQTLCANCHRLKTKRNRDWAS